MSKNYDTYETVPILERLPLHIECIAAYDDYLLVGTRQGHLLMYSIQQGVSSTAGRSTCEVQLLRSNKYFSKKPVMQLDVVPEHQILVSLSDNMVSVHDVSVVNFPFITLVQKSKGATCFALDVQRQVSLTGEMAVVVRLCVVVKRKLQLYYWKNRDFQDFIGPDLSVPDIPRSLVWNRDTFCIGFKGEYCLLKLDGEQKDLFPTGKQPEPLMCTFQEDKFALCRDEQTILVDSDGNPSKKYIVSWSETPSAIVEDFPFILGLLPSCLEVRAMEPKILIQKIEFPKSRLVCKAQGRRGLIYVASSSHVWGLQLVPIHQQVAPLLADKHFQLAIQLANMSEEPEDIRKEQVQHIQSLYAFDLFRNKRFEEAFQLFLQLKTDPAYVIGLFPDLLPEVYRKQLEYPEEPITLQPRELEQALQSLIKFLTEVRNSLMSANPRLSGVADSSGTKSRRQLLQIVDTSLLKCYLVTNDALVAPLLRLRDNNCHLKESEQALRKHHKHAELIILYQTRGLHKEALELLKKHATTMENCGSPLSHHDRTVQYLQHLGPEHIDLIFEFSDWVLAFHPEDGLKIFTEDLHEVEELPRAKVYDFLYKNHSHLALSYLEHVIFEWKDTNALFHNALAVQYKNRIIEMQSSTEKFSQTTSLSEMRQKLKQFLLDSKHCTPEAVLVQFPFDDFFEERAILLGKLGRHEQALSIYVHILKDIAGALNYCERSYQPNHNSGSDVYFHLLRLLLQPWAVAQVPGLVYSQPVPNVADTDTALDLLDRYASKIDPMKVLEILPSNIPLKRLRTFLKRCVEASTAEKRKLQLLRGLLYAEHLQVHEQRIEKQNQKIIMTESNICYVCKKRFGSHSAFVRRANGEIVHYSCQEKRTPV
nr:EOG090X0131 [Eulimnadia texana]